MTAMKIANETEQDRLMEHANSCEDCRRRSLIKGGLCPEGWRLMQAVVAAPYRIRPSEPQ
jgi:hypothetical protein